MSRYQPLKHNTKNAQIQWVNTLVHIHDLQCNCNDPLEHTTTTIFRQEPNLRFTDHEKNLIKRCLTTGEEKDTQDAGDVIGQGDLDALFAQDFGEEEKDSTTG